MRKKFTALILAASATILTACSQESIVENAKYETVAGRMFIRHKLTDGYSVLEERDSGICYLEYNESYQYGITPLLNLDGTPKIWEYAGG